VNIASGMKLPVDIVCKHNLLRFPSLQLLDV